MGDERDQSWAGIEGFDWDVGNSRKIWRRHRVMQAECEQVLMGRPLVVRPDARHSATEPRQFALGRTTAGRLLCVVFTIRGERLRVISARPMSRRERAIYATTQIQDQRP